MRQLIQRLTSIPGSVDPPEAPKGPAGSLRRRLVGMSVTVALIASGTATAQTLPGTDGRTHAALNPTGAKAAVVFFLTTECPISNKLVPEMRAIAKKYSAVGFRFSFVNVEPGASSKAVARHAKEYGLPVPVLLDRKHALARKLGITKTPEVAVVLPGQKLVYRGRINDAFIDLGKPRAVPRSHDLRDALDAVLTGMPVRRPRTTPVGCLLPPLD